MKLSHLLDTNICIYITKHHPAEVLQHFQQFKPGELGISAITYGELLYGIKKSSKSQHNLQLLKKLTSLLPVLPISEAVCEHYATVRSFLEQQGKIIGGNDLWIAAHALALEVTLVSN